MALALGDFLKYMHFAKFLTSYACFKLFISHIFIPVACLDVSEYLPVYLTPFVDVIFRYRVESDLARHVTSF